MSIYAYSPKKSSIQCLHYIIIILNCQIFSLRTLTISRRFDIILSVTRLNILNFRAINSVGRVLPSHGRSREFESLIAHQWELRSHPWFLFICVKGVAGIIVKTKIAEKKISYDWLTKPRQNGKFVKRTK